MKKSILTLAAISSLNAAIISDVKFSGLYHLSHDLAKTISNLEVGYDANNLLLDRALKRLYNYGYFDDIKITQDKSGVVLVDVKEKPFVAKVDIKGAPSNDKKALEQIISLRKGEPLDELKLRLAVEKVVAFYESRGYYDSTVKIEKKPLDEQASAVVFHINRGEPIIIKDVHLIGAKKLKYSDFNEAIANRKADALGWMWGFDDGKLKSAELANDPLRIKNEYLKRGYLDAVVSNGFLSAQMQGYSADLTYYINEGERYKISDISFDNPLSEIEINKSDLKSAEKKYFNSDKIKKDIEIIKTKFQDKGYAFAQVEPLIDKNQDDHTVAIRFAINPGEVYKIAQVIIDGNDKSQDKIIRRELYLTEGMTFSRTDLNDSLNALKRTGYFEDVQIIPEPSFEPNALNLHVVVKERPTGSITGGIGYSTADGFLISGAVRDRNLLGTGLDGLVNIEKSKKDLTGRIRLANPRLFDSKYSLAGSIYSYSHEWNNYEELNKGLSIDLGRDLTRHLSAGLTYNYEVSDLRKANVNMILSGEKLGKSTKSAITPYLYFDNTDDFYLPRSGVIARSSLTYAGLGGDQKYKKASLEFKYFKGLEDELDMDLIFRFKAGFNKLFNYDDTPINSRLYLGGISSLRGFEASSVTPKGHTYYKTGLGVQGVELNNLAKISKVEYESFIKAHKNDDALAQLIERAGIYEYDKGGGISFNSSLELSFPLSYKLKLRGSLFYDYGMIGVSNIGDIKRHSVGLSLDWTTPMGPLNFVFAKPLNAKDGDKKSTFEFSIGSQF